MPVAHHHHSRNERTSEEGEDEGSLCRSEPGEGDGAQGARDDRGGEGADEEGEQHGAGQERTATKRRCDGTEAHAPQLHPEDMSDHPGQERDSARGDAESPGREQGAPPHLEGIRRRTVAQPKANQGTRGGGPSEEAHREPGAKSVIQHGRKQEGESDLLKGGTPRLPELYTGYIHQAVPTSTPMEQPTTTQQATILVVEDRREVLDVLQRTLSENGYRVLTATDGDEGLQTALDAKPDLVILDIGLPKRNGLAVSRELRARAFTAPVLMLTARDTVPDKVEGFDAGADDYLSKPFEYDELLARVKALLRRATMREEATLLRVGELTINPLTRDVTRSGRAIALTQKEYALLEYLVRHAGMPVTREQISEQVWKQPFDPTTNIVDVYINYLRKKIDQDADQALVHTVRGVGYMLKAD